MLRIGITGVPGAGKTTLSRALVAALKQEYPHIELVNEYARRYISKHGSIDSIFEQYRILEKQLEWEDSVCNEKLDIMITDSPVFLGFIYCCDLPKTNSKEIMFFNDVFKKMVKINNPTPRYDIVFHLDTTFKPVDDGIRPSAHFQDDWRNRADTMIRATMEIFRPKKFFVVSGATLEERTQFCIEEIRDVQNSNISKV